MKQQDIDALYRLLNYIQIEGDVGDKLKVSSEPEPLAIVYTQSKMFKKLIKDARDALHRLEKK